MPALNELMIQAVRDFGDAPAVRFDRRDLTYAELDRAFDHVGRALLDLGLAPGEQSAILQYNSDRWLACEGGQAKAGICTVPINQRLSADEIAWQLDHSESRAVLFRPDAAPVVDVIRGRLQTCRHLLCLPDGRGEVPAWATDFDAVLAATAAGGDSDGFDVRMEDRWRVMYTSATTGKPKGVVITHERFSAHVVTTLVNQLRDVRAGDRYLAVTPFTHMAIGFAWPFLACGGTVVPLDRWDPALFLKTCREERITHTVLAPTLIIALLQHLDEHPEALEDWRAGCVRAIWYAASPIPVAVARRAEEVLGPVLNQMYGATELFGNGNGMTCTQLTAEWHARKTETCGRVQHNNAVRVIDDAGADVPVGEPGEVVVLAHHPAGYWKDPQATRETIVDGWIHTGDIGRFDEDGFLTIVDRKKDMIISGGLNVYPIEIEEVLHQHPAVLQAAVIGISDPYWVEAPCAYVVPKPGATVDGEELRAFVRDRLAHFKAPKEVVLIDELPLSPTGKVLKRVLRERRAAAEAGAAV
jgi:acyl-CoA synthetase (AMP-forming)/AMP-acid ligase II